MTPRIALPARKSKSAQAAAMEKASFIPPE
jgi:hypothetical protein